jgi:hypothetical protein
MTPTQLQALFRSYVVEAWSAERAGPPYDAFLSLGTAWPCVRPEVRLAAMVARLAPGGCILMLDVPLSSRAFLPLALAREPVADIVVEADLRRDAVMLGLALHIELVSSDRPGSAAWVTTRMRWLCGLLPCRADVLLWHAAAMRPSRTAPTARTGARAA